MSVRLVSTMIAVLAFATPVMAQQLTAPAPVASTVSAPAVSASPRINDNVVGVRSAAATAVVAPAPAPQVRNRGTAMMVLGGAALLVGAVVGGDAGTIVMIGGGIIGLVGLWNYLQ